VAAWWLNEHRASRMGNITRRLSLGHLLMFGGMGSTSQAAGHVSQAGGKALLFMALGQNIWATSLPSFFIARN